MSRLYKIVTFGVTESSAEDHFFCDLCGFILKTESDLQSHSANLCCNECFLTFVESRKDEWKGGWRPKKSVIQKYINTRKRLLINATKYQELL